MSISVIVPAHNEERYLAETLKNILRAKEMLLKRDAVQTEIIVVDNDSTDSTPEIASSFGGRTAAPPGAASLLVRSCSPSVMAANGDSCPDSRVNITQVGASK